MLTAIAWRMLRRRLARRLLDVRGFEMLAGILPRLCFIRSAVVLQIEPHSFIIL